MSVVHASVESEAGRGLGGLREGSGSTPRARHKKMVSRMIPKHRSLWHRRADVDLERWCLGRANPPVAVAA
jgi:hypothetical protein